MVARLAAELIDELGPLTDQLVTMLRQADESYLAVDIEDLRRSVRGNLASFVGDLASQRSPSTSSSRDTARRRAEQGVPLGSLLHAYRLGFHVIWGALADRALRKGPEWLDGLVRGSATVWAWVDTSSEAVNAEYRDALVESARKDEQQRMLLLDALFEGRLGEWKMLGGSLPAIGLPERGPYLAVSAETAGAGTENLPGVGQFLRRRGVPSAWRLRADEQVGLVAISHDRNALIIRDLLAEVATGRVGISPEYDDALDTGRGLGIAAVARRCLPPGSTGVASIDDDSVAALVAGAPEISVRLVHGLLGRVVALAPEERDILLGHVADLARVRRERLRRRTAAVLPPQHRAQPAAPPRRAQRSVTQRSPRRGRPVYRRSGSQAPRAGPGAASGVTAAAARRDRGFPHQGEIGEAAARRTRPAPATSTPLIGCHPHHAGAVFSSGYRTESQPAVACRSCSAYRRCGGCNASWGCAGKASRRADRPCRCWSPARGSASPTAASTAAKESPATGICSR